MKFSNINKILFYLIFFIMFSSCNYKPLFDKDQISNLKIQDIEIGGDKRIGQMVVNKLNMVKNSSGNLTLFINASKSVDITNRSTSGKILEYRITLIFKVEAKNFLTGNTVYSKKITNSENYKASSLYSDTINSERKIIENISGIVAKQIINEISLVLKNDI